jgi:hypothetical protein
MPDRVARTLATVSTVAALLVAASPPAAHASGCRSPFTSSFRAMLARQFPHQRVTAAVYDTRDHCWYFLHRTMRITTASVIKAQVLGAVLLRDQDHGHGLTTWEVARVRPMIRFSYNNPYVSDLYSHVGGVPGMDRLSRRLGATHTTNTAEYGATWTTAEDRTRIVRAMLYGGGPLRRPARLTAWGYMRSVQPTQRWGITAGGPRRWQIALKNGFYPMSGYGWRVGSTGFARSPDGREGYLVTILTDHDADQFSGIHLVQRVSRQIARVLTGEDPVRHPVDKSICVEAHSGQSWTTISRRLGVPTSWWSDVRRVSGGNPSPLEGQRVCSPRLAPTW